MKKIKYIMLAAIASLMSAVGASASEGWKTMIITLTNGMDKIELELTGQPTLKFDGNQVEVLNYDYSLFDLSIADIVNVTYSDEVNSLGDATANTLAADLTPEYIRISGVAEGTIAELFNLSGVRLAAMAADCTGTIVLPLADYQAGIYIVKVNNQSFKIVKK